jgi:hypothetical protein
LFAENSSTDDCCAMEGDLKVHAMRFVRVESLVGHEDWIRAMDFTLDGKYLYF